MNKTRLRRSAKIALIEFLRPGPQWPYPYTIEIAFQSLRWLVASAAGDKYVTQHRWHKTCAVGLMGGEWAVNGACKPIKNLPDLRSRFHQSLLSGSECRPEVQRWRDDKGIHVGAVIAMAFRHYKPFSPPDPFGCESGVAHALVELLESSAGKTLTTQLNPVHAGAKIIHSVDIIVGKDGFRFKLHYGFVDPAVDEYDSEWHYQLAQTEGDESFLDTLARAMAAFDQLTEPCDAETGTTICDQEERA